VEVTSPSDPAAKHLITHGRLDVEGRLVDASNVTLYCGVELDGMSGHAVYKPVSGERPLWDFPDGTLAGREVATALLSEASGIGHIPPTVLRAGPYGAGMVQLWVATTGEELIDVVPPAEVPEGWRVVLRAHDRLGEPAVLAHADRPGIRDLAILDIIANNTDRKGGHVLASADGQVYGVDHGVCLHAEPKLRTVLWGWIGEPLPAESLERLRALPERLHGSLGDELADHLTAVEIVAIAERAEKLVCTGVFPEPDGRAIPWPLF
jgi:uncharacterized repeat protein (TIGR03843 family)